MIYDMSKLPGALKLADFNAEKFVDKFAISSPLRDHVVGMLLGRITRVSAARVYYLREVNGMAIREAWTPIKSIAFVVDTEAEYELLDAYDRRRRARIEERVQREAEDFRNRILLHNSTGRGLE